MPFTAEETAIYDWIRGSLPSWLFERARAEEEMGALVKIFARVQTQVDFWRAQGGILTAVGATGLEPDWLGQHARDRDTSRANAETDAALRQRLRTFTDMLTRPALLALIDAMLDAGGVSSNDFGLVELRRDRAWFLTRQQSTGTGAGADAFTKVGTTMTLTLAAAPWAAWMQGKILTIAGATSGANNGDFTITGFTGNTGVKYTNASGIAETYGGTWKVNGALHNRKDAYFGRGYRMSGPGQPAAMVAITPFGTTEALRLAIHEALRQRKAAGILHYTERRLVA